MPLPACLTPAEHAALDGDAQRAERLERGAAVLEIARYGAVSSLEVAEVTLQNIGPIARPLHDLLCRHADELAALANTTRAHIAAEAASGH